MPKDTKPINVLVTGATGYIGGRLLERISSQECLNIRCIARNPETVRERLEQHGEIVKADLLDYGSIESALQGIDVAYYLVHSMAIKSGSFEKKDKTAAENFAKAARASGIKKIIYLGGLGADSDSLSSHLKSRHEVGEILRASGILTVEFRASIILGSGSLSFEMVRALVEKLPIMVTPRWVKVEAQPISIEDVIEYLQQAIYYDSTNSKIFEIGGSDQVSYGDIMKIYAKVRGIRLFMIPVPLLTPYLSSLWLGLVTPLYARVGKKLILGVVNNTVVQNTEAMAAFDIKPMSTEAAIKRAIVNEDRKYAATRWSDSMSSSEREKNKFHLRFASRVIYTKAIVVDADQSTAFRPIELIGGDIGWYGYEFLWKIRGLIDTLLGGVGVRRGRSNPDRIRVGDSVDFWRVEKYIPNSLLRLKAEMKLPGRAWLEFDVISLKNNKSKIRVTAIFDPLRILGRLYWYSLYPIHFFIFGAMLKNISTKIKKLTKEETDD